MAFPTIRTGRKAPDDDLDQLARIRADKLQQEQRAKEAPRREQQYQDQQDQAAAAGQGGGVQYTGGKADSRDARDKQAEAGMKRQAEGDDLDQLARSRLEREKERKAAADELAAGKQKALAQGAARAGLGGFGLSGASATLQSDIGRTQDRSATLAMAQLDRGQRDEDFLAIQRQAALDDLEDAQGKDLDGDGKVAGEEERKRDSALEAVTPNKADEYVAGNKGSAKEISAAEFGSLPPGGTATPDKDGFVYIVTNENPRRFLKVKASAIGAGRD